MWHPHGAQLHEAIKCLPQPTSSSGHGRNPTGRVWIATSREVCPHALQNDGTDPGKSRNTPHRKHQVIAEADRPAYAEGIATATDFSRSIIRQATDLLHAAGVTEPGRYLAALMHTTVDHALVEAGVDDIRPPAD